MSTPYLGQVQAFSFNFAPKGWAQCNGQLLPINQNQALFSLLGTVYGGDGRVTFGLPNLQGKLALGFNNTYPQGSTGGEYAHTLLDSETPAHTHPTSASSNAGTQSTPVGNLPSVSTQPSYSSTAPGSNTVNLGGGSSPNAGGQPHENRPPFLVLNYCIALQGIFPSRN